MTRVSHHIYRSSWHGVLSYLPQGMLCDLLRSLTSHAAACITRICAKPLAWQLVSVRPALVRVKLIT